MSDKIELMRLCGVLQSNFSCLSQSELRTQLCHVRMHILITQNRVFVSNVCQVTVGSRRAPKLCFHDVLRN